MGVPLGTSFDVATTEPVDSRMVWTGNATNLNNIINEYPGLITYITGDQNLYVFQGGTPGTWEKIVTTNVDTIANISSNFTFDSTHNGQVLYVNSSQNITGTLPPLGPFLNAIPSGYNVSIVQLGDGNVIFQGTASTFFRNRLNLNRTAGKFAVASILRVNQTEFLLYGDLF